MMKMAAMMMPRMTATNSTQTEGKGVYVTVTRRDTGEEIDLSEEGNGAPDDLDRIVSYVRAHRYKYVVSRVQDALLDVWQRERLGLMI
jgi:hypothetical protein